MLDSGCAEPNLDADDRRLAIGAPPLVSIVIVNTNELHHLQRCLPALFRQTYPNYEVLIVDNASTDASIEWVAETYPQATIIRNQANLGYAGANNVGFDHARGEFIAVLNPDTEVDPLWLVELVAVLQASPEIGLVTPKVVHMDRPAAINACGNDVTITGLTFCRGLDEPADRFNELQRVPAVSGAAFVIRHDLLDRIGPFDKSFFVYFEDTDLSLRAQLAGYTCVFVPRAIVRHQYIFKLNPRKCFYQERNRYVTIFRLFRWPTLIALTPAMLLSEVIVWGYLVLRGPRIMWAKLCSYAGVIAALPQVISDRRRLGAIRGVPDREILRQLGTRLTLAQTATPAVRLVAEGLFNPLLALCGGLARMVVRW
jgi:GT2 family glycosyltransferase